ENGSLIPWLTGTALIHAMLAWQYCGALKKTALSLPVVTLGLCNFATFLTRSGVFSSLHAFGESTVGWMFLGLMIAVLVGGGVPVLIRRKELAPDRPIPSLWSREAMVSVSAVALLLLAAVTLVGTVTTPVSRMLLGRGIVVGTAVYNNVLIPTGLALLATTAAAPLLRWGGPPRPPQKKALFLAAGVGGVAAMAAWAVGLWHPIGLAVAGLAAMAAATLGGALWLDVRRADSCGPARRVWQTVRDGRRRYAGYLIHLGFIGLAVGVAGSSLGTRRREVVIGEGQTVEWAGRSIRCVKLIERELADKLVAEVQLEVSRRSVFRHSAAVTTLRPAQHLHRLQREWTTEVAIDSTWRGDFYVILHGGEGEKAVSLTLIENPMMRWMWCGGWLAGAGALIGLCPIGSNPRRQSVVPAPKRLVYSGRPRRLARTTDG
ncbi:MAG: cytochrome c-type biogenesis CcmF C-terminal domain-containing protein, partial [Planctomycetota bacterium]